VILDLALPHDTDPELGALPGVHRLDKPYVPSELLRAVRDALA